MANVAKHSRTTKATFSIRFSPGAFAIGVRDVGVGLPESPPRAAGNGRHGIVGMDLADAIQLIRVNSLPRSYSGQLDSFVRVKFDELWQAARVSEDY